MATCRGKTSSCGRWDDEGGDSQSNVRFFFHPLHKGETLGLPQRCQGFNGILQVGAHRDWLLRGSDQWGSQTVNITSLGGLSPELWSWTSSSPDGQNLEKERWLRRCPESDTPSNAQSSGRE